MKRKLNICKKMVSGGLAFILMTILLSGCGNKKEVKNDMKDSTDVTVENNTSDKEDNEDSKKENIEILNIELKNVNMFIEDDTFINCSYSIPKLLEKDKKTYPELSKAFEKYASDCEKNIKEAENDLIEIAEADGEDKTYKELSNRSTSEIMRADSNIVSIYNRYETYYGGPHGDYGYTGVNFDTQTGKRLKITDVKKNTEKLYEVVDSKLKQEYPDYYDTFYSVEENFEKFIESEDAGIEWTISSEGVNIYFNNYIIAPYSCGPQIISIGFKEEPELFFEQYTKVSSEYVIPYTENTANYIDVDGDGKNERITVYYHMDDDMNSYFWEINVDEKTIKIDYTNGLPDGYIMYSGGKYYLYLLDEYENGGLLKMIDLQKVKYNQDKDESMGFLTLDNEYFEDENRYMVSESQAAITNPASFIMKKTFYALSTVTAYKNYKVGKDGYPVETDDLFKVASDIVLKAKMDIECDIVDIDGNVTGKGKVEKDKYYRFVHISEDEWVDLQEIDSDDVEITGNDNFRTYMNKSDTDVNEKKEIYRVHLEWNEKDGVRTVEGIDEYEVFDGIAYAG